MDKFEILKQKIVSKTEAQKLVEQWRLKSDKIVFTNGCFDILHYGHIDYLAKTASFGNRLIVGLNADESVKKLGKGNTRPIQNETSRATILAALGFVDAVVVFAEETPLELIRIIKPDVLVKGGDWKIETIVGSDFVRSYHGEVTTIPFVEGFSTTLIEQKIKSTN